jgi:hypothetical protein
MSSGLFYLTKRRSSNSFPPLSNSWDSLLEALHIWSRLHGVLVDLMGMMHMQLGVLIPKGFSKPMRF